MEDTFMECFFDRRRELGVRELGFNTPMAGEVRVQATRQGLVTRTTKYPVVFVLGSDLPESAKLRIIAVASNPSAQELEELLARSIRM